MLGLKLNHVSKRGHWSFYWYSNPFGKVEEADETAPSGSFDFNSLPPVRWGSNFKSVIPKTISWIKFTWVHFLWNCSQVNIREYLWWLVNTGSANSLAPLSNKPIPESNFDPDLCRLIGLPDRNELNKCYFWINPDTCIVTYTLPVYATFILIIFQNNNYCGPRWF